MCTDTEILSPALTPSAPHTDARSATVMACVAMATWKMSAKLFTVKLICFVIYHSGRGEADRDKQEAEKQLCRDVTSWE